MSVTISALTRFHVFRAASYLAKAGKLDRLTTAYPKFYVNKALELDGYVYSLPKYAILRQLLVFGRKYGLKLNSLQEFIHTSFGKISAKSLHRKSSIHIGLSSFMQEAIKSNKNIINITDHGSLHVLKEKEILEPVYSYFGLKPSGNWSQRWMIERMKYEFGRSDYIFCCSQLAKDTMLEYGIDQDRVFVNPLGVDLEQFYPKKRKGNSRFRFLHVSNMSPVKGLHVIVDAFNKLDNLDAELWLVGPLPGRDYLTKLNITNTRIKIFGSIAEEKLIDIYNECDVFVHPSIVDGWAMTVLQAIACGVGVIVSEMTGVKEVVTKENGWVVESQNVDRLSEIMEYVYFNRDILQNIKECAKNDLLNRYSWNLYGQRLNTFIDSLGGK